MAEFNTHPSVQKILDFKIAKRYINEVILEEEKGLEDGIKLESILDASSDIYFDEEREKASLRHSGVIKIINAIGAELREPKVEKTGSGEVVVVQSIKFGKMGEFPGVGEATKENAKGNGTGVFYLNGQAHNRAINRAVTRGLGLYPYLAEEDPDQAKIFNGKMDIEVARKVDEQLRIREKDIRNEYKEKIEKYEKSQNSNKKYIDSLLDYVATPNDDKKYPNQKIKDIDDLMYLRGLQRHEDEIIQKTASHFYRIRKKEEINKKEGKTTKKGGLMGKIVNQKAKNEQKESPIFKEIEEPTKKEQEFAENLFELPEEMTKGKETSKIKTNKEVESGLKDELKKLKNKKD